MGRSQQAIDQAGIGIGPLVVDECLDLLACGRQSNQIVTDAANERATVRGGRGFKLLFLEHRQDEIVNRRLHPAQIFDGGRRGFSYWLKCPMPAARFIDVGERPWAGGGTRKRRAHFHPGFQTGDLLRSKFLVLGRHLQVRVRVTDGLDQQAPFSVTGDNSRTGISALEHSSGRIEPQTTLEFLGLLTVAAITMFREQGPDCFLEEFKLLRSRRGGRRSQGPGENEKDDN